MAEELVLEKKRRRWAKLADIVLWMFYQLHSTITLRRWKKPRSIQKVLVYASMFIGESVIAREAIESIKRHYPQTAVVIHPSVKSLFEGMSIIEYVAPWLSYGEKISLSKIMDFFRFTRKLKQAKFDMAIDLRGDMRNNLILYLSGAPTRIGYGNTGGKYFLTQVVPLTETLEVKRNNAIAKEVGADPKEYTSLAIDQKDQEIVLETLKKHGIKPRERVVVIVPSAGYWTKQWPKQRWVEVIDRLPDSIHVVLAGAPSDSEFKDIAKNTKRKTIDLIGELKLLQSAALFQRSSLVVGSDNGAMHIAAGVGANTLTLFGPTRPDRWRPYGKGTHAIIDKQQYCSPCGRLNDCPINKECMQRIEVDEVAEAIKRLVK